ncbi:hypothetical protein [Paenibacillus luteus]|nr:hypothetical protein [Paenibacillus luteus]
MITKHHFPFYEYPYEWCSSPYSSFALQPLYAMPVEATTLLNKWNFKGCV